MKKYLISQFGRPHGLVGRLAGSIMAHRASNKLRNRWTVGLLNLEPSHQVLEVGSGPGIALAQVAGCLTSGRVVGLDYSKTMHDMAANRNRQAIRDGRVSLVIGSAKNSIKRQTRHSMDRSTISSELTSLCFGMIRSVHSRCLAGGSVAPAAGIYISTSSWIGKRRSGVVCRESNGRESA